MRYDDFLKNKLKYSDSVGFDPLYKNESLFEFQTDITNWAIRRGRAAIFADCGMGKTIMQLAWAANVHHNTAKPVLILSPLAVSRQTAREGEKFGIDCKVVESADDIVNGINVTNYHKLHKFDASVFGGVVLDESAILKNFQGKFRKQIQEEFERTPYKLACTATRMHPPRNACDVFYQRRWEYR